MKRMDDLERSMYFLQEARNIVDKYEAHIDHCVGNMRHKKNEMKKEYLRFKLIEVISSDEVDFALEAQHEID